MPQEIFLFDDTLRANIAFGAPKEEVDDDEIYRVLGLLRLDEMLAATDAEVEAVEGVGDIRAKEIREGLRRLQEINLVDRYLQT